jgi:hypothetical protein
MWSTLVLAACGPVLLVAEPTETTDAELAHSPLPAATAAHTPSEPQTVDPMSEDGVPLTALEDDGAPPHVELTFRSVDCGSCFDVTARGNGGVPPYRYEWEDGSSERARRVCVGALEQVVSVTVEDANGERSMARAANLQTTAADACPATAPVSTLCLTNPSFEGTANVNTGQVFDAVPWSACVDPSAPFANTPDIASDTIDPVSGIAPPAAEGTTYLAMTAGEQASQSLCEVLPASAETHLRLDAMRFDLGGPDVYLQIWSSDAASCTQREQLWTSPALQTTWQSYCVTLAPTVSANQLTLRAATQMPVPGLMTTYLAVDNLVPVDACP